mmetsp:Transcript_4210/g.13373  ORF Transcript_4210/g.13373 Transcript_4210/m.13373 type:complete len:302 (-) Transcript_4210:718-1623(-)
MPEHVPEVDVKESPAALHHHIVVVAVADPEHACEHAVCRARAYEPIDGLLLCVLRVVARPQPVPKVLFPQVGRSTAAGVHSDAVGRVGVQYHFQHPGISARGHAFVHGDLEVHPLLLPQRVHHTQHTKHQLVLPQVVTGFEDNQHMVTAPLAPPYQPQWLLLGPHRFALVDHEVGDLDSWVEGQPVPRREGDRSESLPCRPCKALSPALARVNDHLRRPLQRRVDFRLQQKLTPHTPPRALRHEASQGAGVCLMCTRKLHFHPQQPIKAESNAGAAHGAVDEEVANRRAPREVEFDCLYQL